MKKQWCLFWSILIFAFSAAVSDTNERPFTSRDAVEMAYFGNIFTSTLDRPYDDGSLSPGGRFAIKITHRGVLSDGVTEGTIWLFDVSNLARSVEDTDVSPDLPTALVRMSASANGYSNDYVNRGNILLHPRWADDGISVYFLGRDGQENRRLYRVGVQDQTIAALSPPDKDVFAYSISGPHVAFLAGRNISVADEWQTTGPESDDIVFGSGTALMPLLFPNFLEYANVQPLALEVWRVHGESAEPILDKATSAPIRVAAQFDYADISVSPDGREAVVRIARPPKHADNAANGTYVIVDLDSSGYREGSDLEEEGLKWTPFSSRDRESTAGIELAVVESLNSPPILVASMRGTEKRRTVFDPNPQLVEVTLLPVDVIEWKDKNGRTIVGGLIKPANFEADRRYPLVIQTHGFNRSRFYRVGYSDTANAGRAIASKDIVVLQVEEPSVWDETPINIEKAGLDVYVSAIDALASKGIIDPAKVGISGYSFTGLTVANSISRAPERFAAAVVANSDPLTLTGYYSYVDSPLDGLTESFFTGAAPIDEGFQAWIEKSPSMSTSSITAPVLVSATDPMHLLSLWDFYAALRYQGKPVEIQYIRSGKHNIVKPDHRLAHQEAIVDWFDFWLNEHEDNDPRKADQYQNWRELKAISDDDGRSGTKLGH